MSNAPTEIANLLYTYARLIDGGDYAGIGKLFAHARLTAEHSDMDVRGEEAIAAHYGRTTRLYPDTRMPKTKHVMTNTLIEVDEEAARPPATPTTRCSRRPRRCRSSRSSLGATRTSSSASTAAGATRRRSSSSTSSAT